MKRRIAFFVLLAFSLVPSLGRADVQAGAGAYLHASVGFETSSSYGYVSVDQSASSGGVSQTAYAFVYDSVRDRVVCEREWQLAPGDFVIDPTLTTARLNAPRTPCGAMTITWNATGSPSVPSTSVYTYQYQADYVEAWAGGYTGREARATGAVGTRTFTSSNWAWLQSGQYVYDWTSK